MKLQLIAILLFFAVVPAFAQQTFDVFFDFNQAEPNQASRLQLQNWAAHNSDAEVSSLLGFADSVDGNSYNKELSVRRIQSVKTILESNNIQFAKNLREKPFGENFKMSKDQAQNRRVTIMYSLEASTSAIKNDSIADDLHALFTNRKPGDLVRLRNIHFIRNREEVIPQSEPILQQLLEVMQSNPKLSIEIHGHICCNPNTYDTRLSYRRAKYIFTYLLENGIPLNRLAYMGFGSSDPIYPIPEQSHAQQVANRRVEILVIRN